MQRLEGADGVWEIRLSPEAMAHGDLYRLRVHWPGGQGDRIPAWARRVVQDPQTLIFNAQVWDPPVPYRWRHDGFRCPTQPPFVYEAHVGMAQEKEGIGTYREFTKNTLPRIVRAGYNVIQLMAIQEHPYYGSFGYQVSSFFAASSRFGPPEDLKELIDAAHAEGICVIMDLIHSHAASNEVEGPGPLRRHATTSISTRARGAATRAGIRAVSITRNTRSCTSCSPTAASGSTNTVSTGSAWTA